MRGLKNMNNEQKRECAFIKYLNTKATAYDIYVNTDIKALAKYMKLRDRLE